MLTPIEEFGRQLIKSQDLDPVYTALVGADLPKPQRKRWLLAYWCYYHAGMASYASEREGAAFWAVMERAAYNLTSPPVGFRWPRGTERRHYRAEKCVNSIKFLSGHNPEYWVNVAATPIDNKEVTTHKDVIAQVSSWPMFGPWIGFKAADMLERCLGVPVRFSDEVALLYDEPRKGLEILKNVWGCDTIPVTYYRLMREFTDLPAPPLHDRACSHQELETVLCKWKSHLGGHYPVGKDTVEVIHGLEGWGETADALRAALGAATRGKVEPAKSARDISEEQRRLIHAH